MLPGQIQQLAAVRAQHDEILAHLEGITSFAKDYQDRDENRPFQAKPIDGFQFSLLDASLMAERTLRAFKALKLSKDTPIPFAPWDQVVSQTATLSGTVNELVAQAAAIRNWSGEVVALSGSKLQSVDSGQVIADITDMTARTVAATDKILISVSDLSGVAGASHAAGNNQVHDIVRDETTQVIQALAQVEGATKEAGTLLDQVRDAAAVVQKLRAEIEKSLAEAKANTASEIDALTKVVAGVGDSATKATSDAAVTASKREEADRLTAQAEAAYKQLSAFEATLQDTQKRLSDTYDRADKLTADFAGQRDKVAEMIAQAERMVSGSTVAGLAHAFDQERQTLEGGMRNAFGWFVVGIALLFVTSSLLAAYVLNIGIPGLEFLTKHTSTDLTLAQVLSRAIIVVAPFWLTLFSARRYRSLFDLRQQYSHKYNMAFSMDGFKNQAPKFAENIAAWVFTIVAANPVLPKPGKSMDTPPPMTVEGMMKEVREIYDKVMGKEPA